MNELQRLDDEFNLADSTATEFEIALDGIQSDDVALDSSFDARNFIEEIGCRAARINEWLMMPKKFV